MSSNHEALRDQIGLYVLGSLSAGERKAFEAHLAGCDECVAEVHALQQPLEALAASAPPAEPSAAVRARVLASVSHRRSTVAWPQLAMAASLVLVAALGSYSWQLRGRVQSLEARLHEALLLVARSDGQLAQARLVADDAQRKLGVLAAPDVAHVVLKGQTVAPQASARALWSRSRGLVFAATNLPPPSAGRTYQLWILAGRNPPISNGWLFKTDPNGSATTLFDTPIDLPAPTAMAVTIEPEGGRPSPTGAMYLVGAVN
jgi:anti-sigma-K factor RskA